VIGKHRCRIDVQSTEAVSALNVGVRREYINHGKPLLLPLSENSIMLIYITATGLTPMPSRIALMIIGAIDSDTLAVKVK